MRDAGLFNNFRGNTPVTVCFNNSRWRKEIDRLNDDKSLRMSAVKAGFIQMTPLFILVLCWVLICGCAGKSRKEPLPDEKLRSVIEENVRDETRRAELLVLSEQFSQILEELMTATDETSQELDKLLVDYGSSREAFDRTFQRYNQKRQILGKRTIALHFQIKALATPVEWEAIEAAMLQLASSQTAVRLRRR